MKCIETKIILQKRSHFKDMTSDSERPGYKVDLVLIIHIILHRMLYMSCHQDLH